MRLALRVVIVVRQQNSETLDGLFLVAQKEAAKRLVVTCVSALKSRYVDPPRFARLIEFFSLPLKQLAIVLPQDQIRPQPSMSAISVCEGMDLYHSMVKA